MDVVTTYKSIRNLSASLCWEEGRVEMGGWLQFGRWEVGCERRRGRRRRNRGRESVGKGSIYWSLPTDSPTEYSVGKFVVDFASGSDTSLLGCPGLNPSVSFVDKFIWIKSTSSRRCNFQKKFHAVGDAAGIYRRNYSVGIYWRHRRWNFSVGYFRQNLRRNYFRR